MKKSINPNLKYMKIKGIIYLVTNRVNGKKYVKIKQTSVIRISKDNICKKYKRMSDAKSEGFNLSCISACCNGKQASHKGYTWRYT